MTLNENLQILATLGSALAIFIFLRVSASKDVKRITEDFQKEIKEIKEEFKEIKEDLKEIKSELKSMDQRLTRLEGRFDERGYWESRALRRNGTDDKEV